MVVAVIVLEVLMEILIAEVIVVIETATKKCITILLSLKIKIFTCGSQ